MKLRKGKVKHILDSSIDAALLAVEIYNKPRTAFRSQGFITLMIIAWTRLFHAYFDKTIGNRYYYKKHGKYELIDGERKAWELSTCIDRYGRLSKAVEANIRFFINLRNKIEHRATIGSETDTLIFGECQALLYNYENLVVELFGTDFALHENLVFSLQFSRLRTCEQVKSNKGALSGEIKDIWNYVAKYRSDLTDDIFGSQEFSVKLICVPRLSNTNRQDLAIEFVKWSELSSEDREKFTKLYAIIKEKIVEKEVIKSVKVVSGDAGQSESNMATDVMTVRVTTDPNEAQTMMVYETLSETLFEDVNKILEANNLLSSDGKRFAYDQSMYYKLYAARNELRLSAEQSRMLVVTGLQIYGPCFFWINKLSDQVFAEVLREFIAVPKYPAITTAMRISILLGGRAKDWIKTRFKKVTYKNEFGTASDIFQKMITCSEIDDPKLAALRMQRSSYIQIDNAKTQIGDLYKDKAKASSLLTDMCKRVAEGNKAERGNCRILDVLAYGSDIEARNYRIIKQLIK